MVSAFSAEALRSVSVSFRGVVDRVKRVFDLNTDEIDGALVIVGSFVATPFIFAKADDATAPGGDVIGASDDETIVVRGLVPRGRSAASDVNGAKRDFTEETDDTAESVIDLEVDAVCSAFDGAGIETGHGVEIIDGTDITVDRPTTSDLEAELAAGETTARARS